MNQTTVSQSNPGAGYVEHAAEIGSAITRTLDSGWFILGNECREFERNFAGFIGGGGCVGVGNGTDALVVSLRAAGVLAGDAVVTVSHTAVATVAAIELAGCVPVLADIDGDSFTMSPESLESCIEAFAAAGRGRIKAVVVVHIYGHPADMVRISEIATRHDLILIEDCAQSHGAACGGRITGSWGAASAFSFYPTKNLGALGDGGAVICGNEAVLSAAKLIREYGWRDRYVSLIPGMNTRLDEIQASILNVKLKYLEFDNNRRCCIAAAYDNGLCNLPIRLPVVLFGSKHVYHQYVIRVKSRDRLRDWARARGVATLIHYPVPIHLQPAYLGRLFLPPGGLPVTEMVSSEILSLPIYPQLSLCDVQSTVRVVSDYFA